MIAMTPSGTRTREIRKPFGRTHPSMTSPTGSARDATWRNPPAMEPIRFSSRRRRSTTVGLTPSDSERSTSTAFAERTTSAEATRRSAAARRASFFCAEEAVARTREAALDRRPSSAMGVVASCEVIGAKGSRRHVGHNGPHNHSSMWELA